MCISNLFEDKEKIIETQEWYSLLSQSPEKYQNCIVKNLTHVKNLHSRVVHEYLQAIIEDLDTGDRTRLDVERQVTQDQVILGRWESSSEGDLFSRLFSRFIGTSSTSSGDLPLPLFSVSFDTDNFKVLDLAGILDRTTKIGGKYNMLTHNCYWFAFAAYKAIKYKFNGREERWKFWNWRGRLIILYQLPQSKAGEFEEERRKRMKWAPGDYRPTWQFLEEVYKSSIRLEANLDEKAEDEIEDILTHLVMTDMDVNKTLGILEDAIVPASLSVDLRLDEAYEQAQQLDEASEYIKVYNNYKDNQQVQDPDDFDDDDAILIPEDFEALEPTDEEMEKLDYVVQVMVGQILAEY